MWARAEATKRGFGLDTAKTVQIVLDGTKGLMHQLEPLFPKASLISYLQPPLEMMHYGDWQKYAAWLKSETRRRLKHGQRTKVPIRAARLGR